MSTASESQKTSKIVAFDPNKPRKAKVDQSELEYEAVIHPCFDDYHVCFKWTILHRGLDDFQIQCADCAASFKLDEFLNSFKEGG